MDDWSGLLACQKGVSGAVDAPWILNFCLFFNMLEMAGGTWRPGMGPRQKTVRKALTRGRGSPYKTASREALGVAPALALMFFYIVVFLEGIRGRRLFLRFGVVVSLSCVSFALFGERSAG